MPLTSDTTRNVVDQEYDLQDQTDELPYWPTYGRELVHELTAPESWMPLAARIPPELFDDILFFVNVDRVSQRKEHNRGSGNYLTRNRGEASPEDVLTDLKQCSLVCLFWANRCREHMFSERTLEIRSYEDAEIFRRYFVGGCSRLTPVNQLIERIDVTQNYSREWAPQTQERQTSFLHLLYLPAIQDKLVDVSIYGPVPDGFNPAKLDTPHWGIPPCIVVPSSFLQKRITIKDVHLPSFYHVARYIRHFPCTTDVSFERITWDGQTPTYLLPQASNEITCQRRPRSPEIGAKYCTDSVHLASTALMLNPNCPLHRLSDEERAWMIKFMTLLWSDKKDLYVYIGFDVSEQATTMRMNPFYFIFEEALSTDRSVSALSVVGMHAYIHEYYEFPANFDALVNHARTHPTIRALVLLFRSINHLQESLKPFLEVLTMATETIELVLAYEKEEEGQAVGVDLVTLELNGRIDTWDDEQSEYYYYSAGMSLQMLQRQLKKKRWMSVH
ncbi:hypothetical protein BC629DRAFT_1596848 [Irpex lacteus]|nr:hypothetical protein BC629DRAFT_1596848 [Irpex lacteus]